MIFKNIKGISLTDGARLRACLCVCTYPHLKHLFANVHLHPAEVPDLVFLYVLTGHNQTDYQMDPDQWDCKPEPVQVDCKPDPSLLQRNAAGASPPELTTQSPQAVIFNNQVLILLELFYV